MDEMARRVLAGARPPWEALLEAWGDVFPLLYELANTPQDPEWHGEGDVQMHSARVLEEVYRLLAGPAAHLEPSQQLSLILGALLHDIAKPLTTRRESIDGRERLVAPRHAERGCAYLAYRLLELGLPHEITHEVLALVAHHHDPKRLVRRDLPAHAYWRLARLANSELLYWLEVADMRGRECADLAKQLEILEFFRLFAESYGAWGTQNPYASWRELIEETLASASPAARALVLGEALRDAEAGLIASPHEALARPYRYRTAFPELVVLCGPSGSGKSQWIRERLPEHEVISLDELRSQIAGKRADQSANGRVRHLATEALRAALRQNQPVVWDATGLRRDFRREVLALGHAYGALTTLIVFHLPWGEFFRRNSARPHPVPDSVLHEQLARLEWPTRDEAHQVHFVDEAGEVRVAR